MTPVDYSLMFVTDDRITDDAVFFSILESALKGGATIVQLREKTLSTLSFYQRAARAKTICYSCGIPLIINDRIDIALAVDADGVHIGQDDMPYAVARRIVGAQKIIGLSVSSTEQAVKASALKGLNYIGVSPLFATSTKTTNLAPPLNLSGLREIRRVYSNPIVSIGGINHSNAREAVNHGSDGIAVVSAISSAKDPELATRTLKELLC